MPGNDFQWFWDQVDQSGGEDACWPWKGDYGGRYGRAHVRRQGIGAHRLALILSGGEPPSDEYCACHTCDNPPCCNPKHLWWGTRQDNANDAAQKGRTSRLPKRKFDHAKMLEERAKGKSYTELAAMFGVYPTSIGKVLKRHIESGGTDPKYAIARSVE